MWTQDVAPLTPLPRCHVTISFLLFCPPRASSSGPWAQRPPPVWPVTVLAAGQRPPHPPSRLFCLLSGEDAVSALARLREHHRGSFHQRAMSGDWGGMQCPSACGHKDPLSLLPRQPSLDWRAEGPHSGRFVSFLLKYGETGARPDNGDDLQSAGPQGCLLGWHQPESSAPLGQGAACPGPHSGHPDLLAAKGRGCAGNFRTPPTPALLSWGCRLHWPLLGSVHSRLIFTWISQP